MHSSVCAPEMSSAPMPRSASTASRSVSSKESPYSFCTSGSDSRRTSSGTYCQRSLPAGSSSLLCWIQTTSTPAARALSIRVAMFATTLSRSCASPTAPFCTSMTSRAVLGRFTSVVMVPPVTCGYAVPTTLCQPYDTIPQPGRIHRCGPALVGAAEDEALAVGGRPAAPDAGSLLRLAVGGDDPRRGGRGGLDVVLALGLAAVECPCPAGRDRCHELLPGVHRDGPLIAELRRAPQQQVLERGQLGAEPGRDGVQRDRRLLGAE